MRVDLLLVPDTGDGSWRWKDFTRMLRSKLWICELEKGAPDLGYA